MQVFFGVLIVELATQENQQFEGSLKCVVEDNKVPRINKIPVEDYLVSVISSEK